MKNIILLIICAAAFSSCKKHKENRIAGVYTGYLELAHIIVNKASGDTSVYTTDEESNVQVQILRDGDDMVFIREIYTLPMSEVSLRKTNRIEVFVDPKDYLLELDVFKNEIYFKETIKSDIIFSNSFQIFEFTGFKEG